MSFDHGDDDEDRVGYGRPPKKHRFKKGASGNPNGRPKRTALGDFDDMMMKLLNEKIDVKEAGAMIRVTKLEGLLKSTYARATQGNAKALRVIEDVLKRQQEQVAVFKKRTVSFTLKLGERDLRPGDTPSHEDDDLE